MTDCPHLSDTELWLDGEGGARAAQIAQHVAACPACRAHADTIRRLDFAAREAAVRIKAPAGLRSRLDDIDAARPAPQADGVSRRRVFAGFAAAASVAAIGSVAALRQRDSGDLSVAVFGDFATHLAADRNLDLTETNPQAVVDWFSPKVPFDLPRLASLSEVDLVGGRLCWLLDRRIAAFNFNRGSEALGLYVADSDGLTCQHAALPQADESPMLLSDGGLNGAFWQEGAIAHALVGQPAPDVIAHLANLLDTYDTSKPG